MSRFRDPMRDVRHALALGGVLALSTFGASPAGARSDGLDLLSDSPIATAPADLIAAAMLLDATPAPVPETVAADPPAAPRTVDPAAVARPLGLGAPVEEADLDSMRGGFLVAEGVAFELGAVVRTLVDGELALATTLNWTEHGLQVERELGAGTVPATAADLHAAAVMAGLDLENLAGDDPVFVTEGGGTALVHRITGADFQNIVVNTESGIEIRQEAQVNLSLPSFDQTQRDWMLGLMGFRMNSDMTNATAGAVGR